MTGTLQEEMALAGVSFGAHATAPVGVETAEPDTQVLPSSQMTPCLLSRRLRSLPSHVSLWCLAVHTDDCAPVLQLLDQMPVMAEHLTGITGVTEDASPPGEAADLAGEPVAGEAEDGKKASRKFREKKGSKGKGSANDDAADVAEEVKELKQEEAEKEEEEKEKFDEAQARGQDDVASVQARSARSWVREVSRCGWPRLRDGVHNTSGPSRSLVSLLLVRRGHSADAADNHQAAGVAGDEDAGVGRRHAATGGREHATARVHRAEPQAVRHLVRGEKGGRPRFHPHAPWRHGMLYPPPHRVPADGGVKEQMRMPLLSYW